MLNRGTTRAEWRMLTLRATEDVFTRLLYTCKDSNTTECIESCLKHTLMQLRESLATCEQCLDEHAVEELLSEAMDTAGFVCAFCLNGSTATDCREAIELLEHYHPCPVGLS